MGKTYDELFSAARSAYGTGAYDDATLEFLFPQLRESEDERIRKGLLDIFKQSQSGHWAGMEIKDIVAWLEKQKEKERIIPEREPTDFEIEVHEIIAQARCDKRLADEAVLKQFEQEAACALMLKVEKQKEQKPVEWSEDTKKRIKIIAEFLRYKGYEDDAEFIESLRPQQKQEWSKVELEFRGEKVKVKRPFFRDDKGRGYSTTEQDEDVAWYALRAWCEKKGVSLYDLYPREEWSEEEKQMLNRIYSCIQWAMDEHAFSSCKRLIGDKEGIALQDFLRSIPSRIIGSPARSRWRH